MKVIFFVVMVVMVVMVVVFISRRSLLLTPKRMNTKKNHIFNGHLATAVGPSRGFCNGNMCTGNPPK
jgi:NADH:ubiquinone oxidoreductase subunit 3 (subunit A)